MFEESDHYNNFYGLNNYKFCQLSESQSELNSLYKEKIALSSSKSIVCGKDNVKDNNNKVSKNNNKISNNSTSDLFIYKENKENSYNIFNDFSSFEDNKNNINDEFFINDKHYKVQNNNDKQKEDFTNTVISIKGKFIKTINKSVSNVINELFENEEINYETKTNMQLLRKKKRRRTKKEIEYENMFKTEDKIHQWKKKGRNRKNIIQNLEENDTHTKFADDNILKKINSVFLQSVNNWLNDSFINDEEEFCIAPKKFLKIKPIFSNLKKKKVIELMKTAFKDIFSNDISNKYKNFQKQHNKNLVEEIYIENKQYFVKFILDLTFIEVFAIFNKETTINEFKGLLLEKIIKENKIVEENKIIEFYNKFNKIDIFLKKVYSEEIKNSKKKDVKDYIERISLLCSNYEIWFIRKSDRKSIKNINLFI